MPYNGVNATTMNNDVPSQNAARAATAASMPPLTMDQVSWGGATATARRRLWIREVRQLTTGGCIVSFGITASTSQLNTTDPTTAYNALVTSLTNAVNSGAYDTSLHAAAVTYGANSTLGSVGADDPVASSFTVEGGTSDNKTELSTGAIVGIVIGCTFGALIIFYAAWHFCTKTASDGQEAKHEKLLPGDNSGARNASKTTVSKQTAPAKKGKQPTKTVGEEVDNNVL